MKRNLLLRQLKEYYYRYPEEQDQVSRMMTFLKSHQDCFERTNQEGHFTGSAWVVNPEHNAVLLTHHRKLNKWLQLGGHADGNSNLLSVSREEAVEESGVTELKLLSTEIFDLDIHPIPPLGRDGTHLHYDVRFLYEAVPENSELIVSTESHDVRWIPLDTVSRLNPEPSMIRMVEKTRTILTLS